MQTLSEPLQKLEFNVFSILLKDPSFLDAFIKTDIEKKQMVSSMDSIKQVSVLMILEIQHNDQFSVPLEWKFW